MNAFHEVNQFNGSVLVAEHGQIIYKGGFGNANMEWFIANKADTTEQFNTSHSPGRIKRMPPNQFSLP